MHSAKAMSEAIRMKRKKMKDEGVENAVDTGPAPQMNPQGILNLKQQAQMEETMDTPEKSMAPDDPADPELDETQKKAGLAKRMARVRKTMHKMKVSD